MLPHSSHNREVVRVRTVRHPVQKCHAPSVGGRSDGADPEPARISERSVLLHEV